MANEHSRSFDGKWGREIRQAEAKEKALRATPPITPSSAAMRAAESVVLVDREAAAKVVDHEAFGLRTIAEVHVSNGRKDWADDAHKTATVLAEVATTIRSLPAAIITRHLAAVDGFAQGVSEMRKKAMQIAESYCEDIPQHVDVTLDRNSFAAGYLCAAGGIRQALSRTTTAPDAAATTSPEKVPNYALVRLLNAAMLHPEQAEGYIRQVIAELDDDSPETPVGGEANRLAFAIESAAVKAGIIKGDQPLTGPQLLMLCDDLATAALRTQEGEGK